MNDTLSLSEIEARIATEQAAAEAANRAINEANQRYAEATRNAAALRLMLRIARAAATGEGMPDVRGTGNY